MNSVQNKTSSLKWAIDELSKQRNDLDAKLKIAHKRDETNALIEEVMAQRKALEQRIAALEDGLKLPLNSWMSHVMNSSQKCKKLTKS